MASSTRALGRFMGWVDQTPLWVIGLASVLGLGLVHELGYELGRHASKKLGIGEGKTHLVSSVLALVGLMMAFTFNAAQNNFRNRQDLVVAEANALGTTYMRIQTLAQPWREQLNQEMLRYLKVRGAFSGIGYDPARLAANTAQTAAQEARLWKTVGLAVQANSVPTLNGPLLQSVNEMFEGAASRRAADDIRIPPAVLLMLVISGFVTATIVGFAGATDRRYWVVTAAVLVVEAMAFCLILALDRPNSYPVRVNQAPMERAIAAIEQSQAVNGPAAQ
jgi:hypothetical protein